MVTIIPQRGHQGCGCNLSIHWGKYFSCLYIQKQIIFTSALALRQRQVFDEIVHRSPQCMLTCLKIIEIWMKMQSRPLHWLLNIYASWFVRLSLWVFCYHFCCGALFFCGLCFEISFIVHDLVNLNWIRLIM